MNRRVLSIGVIASSLSALFGIRSAEARQTDPTTRSDTGSRYLRSNAGDFLSTGGPYTHKGTGGMYQVGVWPARHWVINQGGDAPNRSAQNLMEIVEHEVASVQEHGGTPFGGGMGILLTRDELTQLRDDIDHVLG